MLSLRRHPQPPLDQFISCLWYWEGARTSHRKERLLPNGEATVVFNLLEDAIRIYDPANTSRFNSFRGSIFSGARSGCFVIDTEEQERVAGIQFKPGGAYPFLNMPAAETEGLSLELSDVWRGQGDVIRDRLLSASNPAALLETLERCLLAQLARPLALHPAIAYAVCSFEREPRTTVGGLAECTGISARRLSQLFGEQVGLAPKLFARVRRFQRVVNLVHGTRSPEWADVALDCGYYDQAHFIHDFSTFSGLTPSAYLALATEHVNHVPIG